MFRYKLFLFLAFLPLYTFAQTGIPVPQMSHCDQAVQQFLSNYNISGASLAISRNGKVVYHRAFGHANLNGTETTQPYHRFRLASVSKPITAVAILHLIEQGQLTLSDTVFGSAGLLGNHPQLSQATITDNRIYDITVQHLLEHTAGWDRSVACLPNPAPPYPYTFTTCDPIAFPLHVTQVLGTSNPASEEDLIQFLLEDGLNFAPGTQYAYSNMGYLILGEIIESISGQSYEAFVQSAIFDPLGLCDFAIGKNLLVDKLEREVEYEGNGFTNLSVYGTGQQVPWEYGGFNLEAMDAHGGWVGTSRELVQLLLAVDGFSSKPDILTPATLTTMSTPSAQNNFYAKGWQVNNFNNWWHTGALDGTATIIVRTNNQFTWAFLLNKRIVGTQSPAFWNDFDALPWNCIQATTAWPNHDLGGIPSSNVTDFTYSNITGTSATIAFTPGDGGRRIVVAKKGGPVLHYPLDGNTYLSNATFGQGQDLGAGSYVVYDGTGDQFTLNGLSANTLYYLTAFEYNQNAATGNEPLYKLCDNRVGTIMTTTGTNTTQIEETNVQLQPNPTTGHCTISLPGHWQQTQLTLYSINGQEWRNERLQGTTHTLNIDDLPQGLYVLRLLHEDGTTVWKRLIKQ